MTAPGGRSGRPVTRPAESIDDTAEVRIERTGQHPRVAPPVIEVDDVWKTYRTGSLEVDALRGVSFEIDAGEYVADHGSVGLGQVDPHAHPRLPRRPDLGDASAWPART